jgi:predicted metalloprotease
MSVRAARQGLAIVLVLMTIFSLLGPAGRAAASHLPPLSDIVLHAGDLPPDFAPADESPMASLLPDGLARQIAVSFRRVAELDGEPGVASVRQVVLAFDDRDATEYVERFRDLMVRRQGYALVAVDEQTFRLSRTRDGETSAVVATAHGEILVITTAAGPAGTVSPDHADGFTRTAVARVPLVEQSAAALSLEPGPASLVNAHVGAGNMDLPAVRGADRWPQPVQNLPPPPDVAVVQARSGRPVGDPTLSNLMPAQHAEVRPQGWPHDLVQYTEGIAPLISQWWGRSLSMTTVDYLPPRMKVVRAGEVVMMGCIGYDGLPAQALELAYCPKDETIYLYEPFMRDDIIAGQDWRSRDFVVATVLAHEWAHHIQNLAGLSLVSSAMIVNNPDNWPLITRQKELQADCYAGMFARGARDNGWLNAGDIQEAQEGLMRAGDSHIDSPGHHGLPEQRKEWFMRGYNHYSFSECQPW